MRTLEADVAVVAAGLSGMAAIVQAAEHGLSVVALEKASTTGGAANMGMGPFAVGTKYQRMQAYDLTPGEAFRQMRLLYDRCQDVRRSGCASLDLCHVAVGRLDAYVELMLQPWDYAAGALIVAEAGGRATTLTGEPLPLTHGSAVLAANAPLHPQLLSLLA